MSPFETYLLFKVNAIIGCVGFLCALPLVAGFFYFVFAGFYASDNINRDGSWDVSSDKETAAKEIKEHIAKHVGMKRRGYFWMILGLCLGLSSQMIPNRNTIIAMQVVPALTSDKAINVATTESKEMYSMFKEWLGIELSRNKIGKEQKKVEAATPKVEEPKEPTADDIPSLVKELVKQELKNQIKENIQK